MSAAPHHELTELHSEVHHLQADTSKLEQLVEKMRGEITQLAISVHHLDRLMRFGLGVVSSLLVAALAAVLIRR